MINEQHDELHEHEIPEMMSDMTDVEFDHHPGAG